MPANANLLYQKMYPLNHMKNRTVQIYRGVYLKIIVILSSRPFAYAVESLGEFRGFIFDCMGLKLHTRHWF